MIESSVLKGAEHVAYMEGYRMFTELWLET